MPVLNMKDWAYRIMHQRSRTAIPIMTHPGIEMISRSVLEAVTDGEIQYLAIQALADRYPGAASTMVMDLTVEAEAFGCLISFPEHDVPVVMTPVAPDQLTEGLYLSSFKCLSRFVVDHVLEYRGPFPYLDGLALRVTRNIGVLESRHLPSRKLRSGYTVGKLLGLWAAMAVNFSVAPLRASSLLGVLFSLAGVLGTIAVTVEKIRRPDLPVGWASLAVAVLALSGVQLLLSGVLGEYIGQLVLTANGTPQYAVRSVTEERDASPGAR